MILAQGKVAIEEAAELGQTLAGLTPAAIFATLFVLAVFALIWFARDRATMRVGYGKALDGKDKILEKASEDLDSVRSDAKASIAEAKLEAKAGAERIVDEIKTESIAELKLIVTGYIDEIKLLRASLAESTVAVNSSKQTMTDIGVTLSKATQLIERLERRLDEPRSS